MLPATKPVSHGCLCPTTTGSTMAPCHHISHWHLKPCPLPPNQSTHNALPPATKLAQSFDLPSTTVAPHSPYHHITTLVSHGCLCPTNANQGPVSYLNLPFYHYQYRNAMTLGLPPCHRIMHISQSFANCPLPPNQSVICLAPCHQTSQSFDLPSTTAASQRRGTTPPCHHITTLGQSSALPPATKPVSHLLYGPCHQTSQSWLTYPLPLWHHGHHSHCVTCNSSVTASLH